MQLDDDWFSGEAGGEEGGKSGKKNQKRRAKAKKGKSGISQENQVDPVEEIRQRLADAKINKVILVFSAMFLCIFGLAIASVSSPFHFSHVSYDITITITL